MAKMVQKSTIKKNLVNTMGKVKFVYDILNRHRMIKYKYNFQNCSIISKSALIG